MGLPIIFTHFGNTDYLSKTLLCAKWSNPTTRKILLGDELNERVAIENGWEHKKLDSYCSTLRSRFDQVFQHIQGPQHGHMVNGKDWLKFVFERWYIIEAFCRSEEIERFWHFDSDVAILEDLEQFEARLVRDVDFTRQCNDTCLNGLVSVEVVTRFCEYTIGLFEDERFLASQKREFDEEHPNWAFTEMRAFNLYSRSSNCQEKGAALESLFDGWWFDDCICQDDGFEMVVLGQGFLDVKGVRFSGGKFTGTRNGEVRRFATLNLSWVPFALFDWVNQCMEKKKKRFILEQRLSRRILEKRISFKKMTSVLLEFLRKVRRRLRELFPGSQGT